MIKGLEWARSTYNIWHFLYCGECTTVFSGFELIAVCITEKPPANACLECERYFNEHTANATKAFNKGAKKNFGTIGAYGRLLGNRAIAKRLQHEDS